MKERNLLDELKTLDILICKKMFGFMKCSKVKSHPSPLQAKIIKYLIQNNDKDICQKDLENELEINKATISGVLLSMEHQDLIERNVSKKDARIKYIRLTNKSLEFFEEIKMGFNKLNESILNGISEEELDKFLKVLEKIKENVKNI